MCNASISIVIVDFLVFVVICLLGFLEIDLESHVMYKNYRGSGYYREFGSLQLGVPADVSADVDVHSPHASSCL